MAHADPIPAGLVGSATLLVTASDTAVALRSGDVEVLGTPRVLALAEQAACAALEGHLPEGITSVGVRVELDHLRPTAVGQTVTAEAILVAVDGRKMDFTLTVLEGEIEVARGTHRRVSAPRSAFAG